MKLVFIQRIKIYIQWRTEHKCRPGRRPQMSPFQEKKLSTNSHKFLTTLFLLIHPKMKILRVTSCAALFWPVPPLIFSSFVRFYRKFYLFSRKFDHFHVNVLVCARLTTCVRSSHDLCALVSRLVCARLTTCVRSSHDLCALVSRLVCARLTTCVRSSHDLCALVSRLVCARLTTCVRSSHDLCALVSRLVCA